MVSVKVNLGPASYPIFIGDNTTEKLGEMLRLYEITGPVIIVTDTNVQAAHHAALGAGLGNSVVLMDTFCIPPGEKSKSIKVIEDLITELLTSKCERNVTILAFGGGVVGDVAGFLAAIYKRGVPYIQVPTTLLAQVDSSIGGKTGVNHALGKNQIGATYQPKMVWTDLAFLRTLPAAQIVSGLGEVVKYAIIADPEMFGQLEQDLQEIIALEPGRLLRIVAKCARIKADIVANDEHEKGQRMMLNFGHTIGHALEATFGYENILHGEAVLLGMAAESNIALARGTLDAKAFSRIEGLIQRFELRRDMAKLRFENIWHLMQSDKKVRSGKVRFVLPKAIGSVEIADDISQEDIRRSLEYLRSNYGLGLKIK